MHIKINWLTPTHFSWILADEDQIVNSQNSDRPISLSLLLQSRTQWARSVTMVEGRFFRDQLSRVVDSGKTVWPSGSWALLIWLPWPWGMALKASSLCIAGLFRVVSVLDCKLCRKQELWFILFIPIVYHSDYIILRSQQQGSMVPTSTNPSQQLLIKFVYAHAYLEVMETRQRK